MTSKHDLAHRLIRRAARSAPPALAERLEEEWSADLAARSGMLSRLRLALGCWWATGVITREFAVPQVATASAAASVRTLIGGGHYDLPLLSRRSVAFAAIVGVHLALIYAFSTGLAQHFRALQATDTAGVVIQETQAPRVAPPVPNLVFRKPVIENVTPEFVPPTDPGSQSVTTDPGDKMGSGVVPPSQPPPVLTRIAGGPGAGFPNPDDYYPAASRRLGESGSTTVQVCVDPRGMLAADPTVAQSSGIPRLDAAALKLAKAGGGHYRPSTENGQPVSSCYAYRIRFRLDD